MNDQKDYEAVSHMVDSFFKVLFDMEKEKPLLFLDSNFSKWTMLAGFNYLCQMAIVNKVDLDFLQKNLEVIWEKINQNKNSKLITN